MPLTQRGREMLEAGKVSVELLNLERRLHDGVRAENDKLRAEVAALRIALNWYGDCAHNKDCLCHARNRKP